jgi:hypothetical protein
VHSALAPASTSTIGVWPGLGMGVAMQGRTTPGRRPMRSSAEAMVAPVLPAETMALAWPSRTSSAQRTSEESFFAHARGGVVVHGDHLGAGHDLEAERVAHQFGHAHQGDGQAQFVDGPARAGDDLPGSEVATHRVHGDGQAQLN